MAGQLLKKGRADQRRLSAPFVVRAKGVRLFSELLRALKPAEMQRYKGIEALVYERR